MLTAFIIKHGTNCQKRFLRHDAHVRAKIFTPVWHRSMPLDPISICLSQALQVIYFGQSSVLKCEEN